ncbi:MAG: hypothetical protein HQL91_07620 [Magnetococcales bacterium]|nr:hypothetical protein [Magnetococcales bacterium]
MLLDLGIGLLLLLVILASTLTDAAPPPEPAEAQSRRLQALNAELTARLLVQEGRIQGLIRGQTTPKPEDWSNTPIPSQAAEWSGVALLRGAVADLTARNEILLNRLHQLESGVPELAQIQTTANVTGQQAQIERLQTEIARLNTRIEEALNETGATRQTRMALEAKLQERDQRITQLDHEINALASRAGILPMPPIPSAPSGPTGSRQPLPRPRMTNP